MVLAAKCSLAAELCHGVAIVSHDAGRTGAPLIALNIARELVEAHGIPVVTILLEAGELEPEFAQLGPMFVARSRLSPTYRLDPRSWARLVKRVIYIKESACRARLWGHILKYLAKRQIRHAVCNTVLSGNAALRLKKAGLTRSVWSTNCLIRSAPMDGQIRLPP
jgi:hypothetical protein